MQWSFLQGIDRESLTLCQPHILADKAKCNIKIWYFIKLEHQLFFINFCKLLLKLLSASLFNNMLTIL